MMTSDKITTTNVVLLALLICAVVYHLSQPRTDNNSQQKIISLEQRIQLLRSELIERDNEITKLQKQAMDQLSFSNRFDTQNNRDSAPVHRGQQAAPVTNNSTVESTGDDLQTIKDLETNSSSDLRSFSQKISDMLSANASEQQVAIVSKAILDKANDREGLPDYELQSLYSQQKDTTVKRVIAQVASLRGDNDLLDAQIAELRPALNSPHANERQEALHQLAQTHYANAADVIAPLLQDSDINVRLDALQALRATGNQNHISLAEKLITDPDPAVSSLASDVVSSLKNLSNLAHTSIASADIAAELPRL